MKKITGAPVIIEGAMKCEMSVILSAMEAAETAEICGFPVTTGLLGGYPVLAALNLIGMPNAACLTALLIERFAPLCLISQGTAGSHREDLRSGDIILARETVCTNCIGMLPEDCRSLEELSGGVWSELQRFPGDAELLHLAGSLPYDGGRLTEGTVGSGDFWSHSPEQIRAIRARFGTDCEDMETFASAKVCSCMGVPFLGVRVISNNELTGEGFAVQSAELCQQYILNLVAALAERQT